MHHGTSASSQDGITWTRYALPLKRLNQKNIWNNNFQCVGYQAFKDRDPWEMRTNELSPTIATAYRLEKVYRLWRREGRYEISWMKSWILESRETMAARGHRTECQRVKCCIEIKLWKSVEGLLWIFSWVPISTGVWSNYPGGGKSHSEGLEKTEANIHTRQKIVPVSTSQIGKLHNSVGIGFCFSNGNK